MSEFIEFVVLSLVIALPWRVLAFFLVVVGVVFAVLWGTVYFFPAPPPPN